MKMDKNGFVYIIGVDDRPKTKYCYRDGERACGLNCMHFWESRNPKGEIDGVHMQCVPHPSPLIPVQVDKI